MIVDDDADLRRGLSLLLGGEFEVREAADGEACLRAVAERRPSLLLLDISMPGLSGMDVLKIVRSENPSVVVLMLTAQADLDLARRALDLGANAYISKPFDFGELRIEVKRLLEGPPPGGKDQDYRPWRVAP